MATMKTTKHTTTGTPNSLQGQDVRAWEGQFAGQHWIARVVHVDEKDGICALHVTTGSDRDDVTGTPNCQWDYNYDHFLNRFANSDLPVGVTYAMREALREWIAAYQRMRPNATFEEARNAAALACSIHPSLHPSHSLRPIHSIAPTYTLSAESIVHASLHPNLIH